MPAALHAVRCCTPARARMRTQPDLAPAQKRTCTHLESVVLRPQPNQLLPPRAAALAAPPQLAHERVRLGRLRRGRRGGLLRGADHQRAVALRLGRRDHGLLLLSKAARQLSCRGDLGVHSLELGLVVEVAVRALGRRLWLRRLLLAARLLVQLCGRGNAQRLAVQARATCAEEGAGRREWGWMEIGVGAVSCGIAGWLIRSLRTAEQRTGPRFPGSHGATVVACTLLTQAATMP
jgi:hypothetical protein